MTQEQTWEFYVSHPTGRPMILHTRVCKRPESTKTYRATQIYAKVKKYPCFGYRIKNS